MKTIILFVGIAALFIIMDVLWFQVAGNFFKAQIGSIARLNDAGNWNIRLLPAILVYLLMALGVMLLVLPRASSLGEALLFGGIFGLVGYGLYDLTNLATLAAWTRSFAIVDMLWGTTLCAVVSTVAHVLSRTSYFS